MIPVWLWFWRIENEADRRAKLDKHADDIKRLAARGVTKLNLARVFQCDWVTVRRFYMRPDGNYWSSWRER